MQKLLLLSIVLAAICFPMLAARGKNPVRALKKTIALIIGFAVFYTFAVRFAW